MRRCVQRFCEIAACPQPSRMPLYWAVAVCAVIHLMSLTARAELPMARLKTIFPPGGQVGATVHATVTGDDLDDAATLCFSHPGLFAQHRTNGPNDQGQRSFTIAVGPDVPPGRYDVRVLGRFGISNCRSFVVDAAPQVTIDKPGRSVASPTIAELGTILNARCGAAALDYYKLELRKDQRVIFECSAEQIESKLSPILALQDLHGRELARSRTGGVIDFTAPRDEAYLLTVNDLLYRGGADYAYRLSLGARPRLDFALPAAGASGADVDFELFGRCLIGGTATPYTTLDRGSIEASTKRISFASAASRSLPATPAAAMLGAVSYSVSQSSLRSTNGISLVAPRNKVVRESTNDDKASPQRIEIPCELAGQFFPRGDEDWVTFDAAKGQSLWIEIASERLGADTSPFLLVQKITPQPDGKPKVEDVAEVYPQPQQEGANPLGMSRDVSYKLDVPVDATYRLMLRDLFNSTHDDPSRTYRLSIAPAHPDFDLFLQAVNPTPEPQVRSLLARRGGALPVRVLLRGDQGFDGDVEVRAENLPQGLTCQPFTLHGNRGQGEILLQADRACATWSGPLRIVGVATLEGKETKRPARELAVVWPAEPGVAAVQWRVDEPALAITGEAEPLEIAVDAKPIDAKVNSTVKVPLQITRTATAAGPLKIHGQGIARAEKIKELSLDASAKDAILEINLAELELKPGTHSLYLRGDGKVKYARNSSEPDKTADIDAIVYSPCITLNVTP